LLAGFRQKQVTDVGQNQMTLQAKPAAALPMIEPQLAFAVLEAAFDPPVAKRHAQ
jgi:hypothetical protein